jgi:hypothetical protein
MLTSRGARCAYGQRRARTRTAASCPFAAAVVMVFLVNVPVQKLVASFKGGPSPRNDPQVQSVSEISAEGAFAEAKSVVLKPGGDKETQRYLNATPVGNPNIVKVGRKKSWDRAL